MRIWIARDENGDLYLHTALKPTKGLEEWEVDLSGTYSDAVLINPELFPNITWEDEEPTEVILTINK